MRIVAVERFPQGLSEAGFSLDKNDRVSLDAEGFGFLEKLVGRLGPGEALCFAKDRSGSYVMFKAEGLSHGQAV